MWLVIWMFLSASSGDNDNNHMLLSLTVWPQGRDHSDHTTTTGSLLILTFMHSNSCLITFPICSTWWGSLNVTGKQSQHLKQHRQGHSHALVWAADSYYRVEGSCRIPYCRETAGSGCSMNTLSAFHQSLKTTLECIIAIDSHASSKLLFYFNFKSHFGVWSSFTKSSLKPLLVDLILEMLFNNENGNFTFWGDDAHSNTNWPRF